MRFARSLGCGFVVLLALCPLASLKVQCGRVGSDRAADALCGGRAAPG